MIELTDKQREVLNEKGHMLVQGGPGSGKTTISILKAGRIARTELHAEQRVLFLSFARATISRVLEAIANEEALTREIKSRIEVDTYHAFFWRLIKTHGYLLDLPRRVGILTPSGEAVALSSVRSNFEAEDKLSVEELAEKKHREHEERYRLAIEDGLVCFDLFANLAGQLLHRSNKVRVLIANAYPVIIMDEFQDTAPDHWYVIRALGRKSRLLALADPEQRIFDFIGADPERLQHFRDEFQCADFDLCDENHRSKGTDLAHFANDILKGTFTKESYNGVHFELFESNTNQALTKITTETLAARARLIKGGSKDWSLAILVPTKRMTRIISDAFREPLGNLPKINHHAAVDLHAAILGAEIIAYLLQSQRGEGDIATFINMICSYFRGKGGDTPSKTSLKEASSISSAYEKAIASFRAGKAVAKNSMYLPIAEAYETARELQLNGDPSEDWVLIRNHLDNANCKRLNEVGREVRNVRLLERGTQLREALSKNWRDNGRYSDALGIVRQAFIHEHFSTSLKPESGIVIMNMHKAKGKQFDEVIIFEGWPKRAKRKIVANPNRIVRGNMREHINNQSRQNLRVSITRAKQRTTILTPRDDICVLLTPGT